MVVAGGASNGEAEPDGAGGVGAILRVNLRVLVFDDARFVGGDVAAMEAGGDALVERRIRKQIAREFPELAALYRKLYARRDYLDEAAQDRLLATFRRLKLEYGFPRSVPGRA